ncbi:ABC transporter permease subunit [Paenibacillus sp. P26]|nr:ABC transporter permease subunit [Paenibacillus sp. P26]
MHQYFADFVRRLRSVPKNAPVPEADYADYRIYDVFRRGLIPFYLIVKGLGITNTLWALILPGAISTFNLIIMRTAFEAIPVGLEESAKMDGANDFTILFRIILPLSLPVIAVILLYYGVSHWNAWFNAMIFLKDRDLYPLQLILREILIVGNTTEMTGEGT